MDPIPPLGDAGPPFRGLVLLAAEGLLDYKRVSAADRKSLSIANKTCGKGIRARLAGVLPIWGEASANATNRVAAHHPPDAPPPPKEPPPPPDFLELLPLSELEWEPEPDRNHDQTE